MFIIKRFTFFLTFLFLIPSIGKSQNTHLNYIKTFPSTTYSTEILKTDEGHFLVGGFRSTPANSVSFYLAKLDSNNEYIMWDTTGVNVNSVGSVGDLVPYKDGGAIISGADSSVKATLMAVEKTGQIDWQYHSGLNETSFQDLKELKDNAGYIAVGFHWDSNLKTSYPLISKINAKGDKIWHRKFGKKYEGFLPHSICSSRDSGWLITGFQEVDTHKYLYDAFVMKLSDSGKVEWENTFKEINYQRGQKIIKAYDSGYIILGTTDDSTERTNSISVELIKINSQGKVIWDQSFGVTADDFPRSIIKDGKGNYIYVGHRNSNSIGRHHAAYKISKNGEILWSKKALDKPEQAMYATDVIKVSDRKFMMVGTRMVNSKSAIFTSIFDEEGNFAKVHQGLKQQKVRYQLFPNPFKNTLTVKSKHGQTEKKPVKLIIYNTNGQRVAERNLTNKTRLNLSTLPPSIYLYKLKNKNGIILQRGRLVKLNN